MAQRALTDVLLARRFVVVRAASRAVVHHLGIGIVAGVGVLFD